MLVYRATHAHIWCPRSVTGISHLVSHRPFAPTAFSLVSTLVRLPPANPSGRVQQLRGLRWDKGWSTWHDEGWPRVQQSTALAKARLTPLTGSLARPALNRPENDPLLGCEWALNIPTDRLGRPCSSAMAIGTGKDSRLGGEGGDWWECSGLFFPRNGEDDVVRAQGLGVMDVRPSLPLVSSHLLLAVWWLLSSECVR